MATPKRHVDLFLVCFSVSQGNADVLVAFRDRQMCQKEIFKYSALTVPKNSSLLSTSQRPFQGEYVNRYILNPIKHRNWKFENNLLHLGENDLL